MTCFRRLFLLVERFIRLLVSAWASATPQDLCPRNFVPGPLCSPPTTLQEFAAEGRIPKAAREQFMWHKRRWRTAVVPALLSVGARGQQAPDGVGVALRAFIQVHYWIACVGVRAVAHLSSITRPRP